MLELLFRRAFLSDMLKMSNEFDVVEQGKYGRPLAPYTSKE
jgi:hypothetical protein